MQEAPSTCRGTTKGGTGISSCAGDLPNYQPRNDQRNAILVVFIVVDATNASQRDVEQMDELIFFKSSVNKQL